MFRHCNIYFCRKSITNSFGGFYANHSGQEESSIGSGESYGPRQTTDDELSGKIQALLEDTSDSF